jgi:hypothetical protein
MTIRALPRKWLIAVAVLGVVMAIVAFVTSAIGSYLPASISLHRVSGTPEQPVVSGNILHFRLKGMPFSFDTREDMVDVRAMEAAWRKQPPTSAVVVYDATTLNTTKPPTHFEVYALTLDGREVFTVESVSSAVRWNDRRGWGVGAVLLLCSVGLWRSAGRQR